MKKIKLTEEFLKQLLTENKVSLRDLEKLSGYSRSTLSRNISKYNLNYLLLSKGNLKKIQYKKIQASLNETLADESKVREIVEKRKATATEKYGSWEMMYKDNTIKREKTNLQKYGVSNPMLNSDVVKYSKEKCLEKYGVENAGWTDESKKKIIQTNLERYGKEFHTNKYKYTEAFSFDKMANDREQLKEFLISLPEKPNMGKLAEMFKLDYTTIQKKIKKMKLTEYISLLSGTSYYEGYVADFIESLGTFNIIRNDRTVLDGLELDIYIPDKNLAIEVNGGYWHSTQFKEKKYHQNKTIMCEKKGIRLIHILDSQWKHQQGIFKSIIRNALKLTPHKIYARKCEIKNIDAKICGSFLKENHLQGFAPAKHYYGLYFEDEIVQVMTFNNSFKTKGYEAELTRNAIRLNTNIIGGTERLFKHFIRSMDPKSIVSYVDMNIFNGMSYTKLGFTIKHITKPNLMWILKDQYFYRSPSRYKEFRQLESEGKIIKYFGSGLKVFEWFKQ